MTIILHKGESRTFRVTAREAKVSKDDNYFELIGPVRLEGSDGFWLETDTATVNRMDSIAHDTWGRHLRQRSHERVRRRFQPRRDATDPADLAAGAGQDR